MPLPEWIAKLKQARHRDEVFAILDDFRAHDWSDEERATVARLYIRLLDGLKSDPASLQAPAAAPQPQPQPALATASTPSIAADLDAEPDPEADGPVWYEKM